MGETIGYSKDAPAMFGSRNGRVVFRYNIEPVEVETEEGVVETQYKFEQREYDVVTDRSIGGIKALLKDVAAGKRWAKETGGAVWNGHAIHTDRESQAKIIAAYVAAKDGVRTDPSGWKTPEGFLSVTNAQAIEMALTVQAHIQTCYDQEAAMIAQIDECATIEDLAALKIEI
jgi:hypothetical protein